MSGHGFIKKYALAKGFRKVSKLLLGSCRTSSFVIEPFNPNLQSLRLFYAKYNDNVLTIDEYLHII